VDINMPKMNGIEVLKELRKVRILWRSPIIIYGTIKDNSHIDQVMALGAVKFITKPMG
jgi:CheY-like chemotaxis protein